jgi:shikimate kinase
MSIILIGYRGSGKTTIGREMAERLRRPFVDTDELIVNAAGMSIKDIFTSGGEPAFRERETQAVLEVAALRKHVIALGGGALIRPENRVALENIWHLIVYLRCDPEVLYQRIHGDPATAANRPSLTHLGGSLDEIRHLLAERESTYRSVARAIVDVTKISASVACDQIEQLARLELGGD